MTQAAAEPRLSATILLLRDQPNLQVLMVKRHYEIDFAAGALVFPGGKANDEDSDPAWSDVIDGNFQGTQQAARIAAIREAFEEAGILLAREADARGVDRPLIRGEMCDSLQGFRSAIDRREMSFLALMKRYNLVLALDQLVHFGHWITPTMMPKRFDTHFFLAQMPSEQCAVNDGYETTDALWLEPGLALDQEATGKATIIFPTRMNLGKLTGTVSVSDALHRFARAPVITVLPELGHDSAGRPCLHIPAEAGYMQVSEPLQRVEHVGRKS